MERESEGGQLQRHVEFSGTLVPLCLGPVALGCLGGAFWSGHHTLMAVAAWLALQALLFWELRFRLLARMASGGEVPDAYVPPAFLGSALTLWLLIGASVGLGYGDSLKAVGVLGGALAIATLTAVLALELALLAYFQRTANVELPEGISLASWCRLSIWMCCGALLCTVLLALGVVESQRPLVQTLMLLSLVPVLEWLIRTLVREQGSASLIADVAIVSLLFGGLNPMRSLFEGLEREAALDVRSTWSVRFAQAALAPLAGVLLLVAWLSTSLTTVNELQSGLRERFGASVAGETLGPGLHLKAPWPIARVHRVDTARVRTMPLGYMGPRQGASLLWTMSHAAEEHRLLLGDGRDLVTFNATLQYRVSDPWRWHYGAQNPAAALRVAAEEALLKSTVGRSLDGVLSENTEALARSIERAIRARVERQQIGVQIIDLSLQGLHPPVEVAEDYQAVISAQHHREIAVLESRSHEIDTLGSARAAAVERVEQARGLAAARLARARGEVAAFGHLQRAHAGAALPFEQRYYLRALEGSLSGRALRLVDHRIEGDGGVLWLED